MLTQDQIKQLIATGVPPETIASMIQQSQNSPPHTPPAQPAPSFYPQTSAASELASIRRAPDPSQAGLSFVDDDGKFDGTYTVRIKSVSVEQKEKGKIMRTVLTVLQSSNMHVSVGSDREYCLFLWNPPALADAKGWIQQLSELKGNTGDFSDQFYIDCTGERNICAGLELSLSVFTKPQKNNKHKSFTHLRFSGTTGMPAIVAAAMPVAAPTPVAPAAGPAKPPGWPDTIPWPPSF